MTRPEYSSLTAAIASACSPPGSVTRKRFSLAAEAKVTTLPPPRDTPEHTVTPPPPARACCAAAADLGAVMRTVTVAERSFCAIGTESRTVTGWTSRGLSSVTCASVVADGNKPMAAISAILNATQGTERETIVTCIAQM